MTYPYETRLNIQYAPLEVIDEKALAAACEYKWYNQTLCQVNGSVVRLGVVQGEYHWHKHDGDDEFFYVVEGELFIDLEERTVPLAPRPGLRRSQRNSAPDARRYADRNSHGRERWDHSDRKRRTMI